MDLGYNGIVDVLQPSPIGKTNSPKVSTTPKSMQRRVLGIV